MALQSSFRVLQRRSASMESLFNVNLVRATHSFAFNDLQRIELGAGDEPYQGTQHLFNVYQRVTATVTMEWNTGMPVQFGLKALGSSRWYAMYPS
jgi:hypothetical protein